MQKNDIKKIYERRKMMLNIMDELDELAEHFTNVDLNITRKIDNIADRLRSYDKV